MAGERCTAAARIVQLMAKVVGKNPPTMSQLWHSTASVFGLYSVSCSRQWLFCLHRRLAETRVHKAQGCDCWPASGRDSHSRWPLFSSVSDRRVFRERIIAPLVSGPRSPGSFCTAEVDKTAAALHNGKQTASTSAAASVVYSTAQRAERLERFLGGRLNFPAAMAALGWNPWDELEARRRGNPRRITSISGRLVKSW